MRLRDLYINLIMFFICSLLCSLSFATDSCNEKVLVGLWNGGLVEYSRDEVLVRFSVTNGLAEVGDFLSASNVTILNATDRSGWARLQIPQSIELISFIDSLKQFPVVLVAHPNFVARPAGLTSDTYIDSLWALKNFGQSNQGDTGTAGVDINAEKAWEITKGSEAVLVGVLDSGIPYDTISSDTIGTLQHPDLNDPMKYLRGKNYAENQDSINIKDYGDHGTAILGILAGETDNDTGIAGVCWHCKVLVSKIGNYDCSTVWRVREAIYDAIDSGCQIINISWDAQYCYFVEEAIDSARKANCLIVAAAGNGVGVISPAGYAFYGTFPGHEDGYENVVGVAATNHHDENQYDYFSGTDSLKPTMAAPGARIFIAYPPYKTTGEPYSYADGTSEAAPYVSGVATLLLSVNTSLSAKQLREILINSAKDVVDPGFDILTGY